MALVYVHCPACQSIDVVQYGKPAHRTQRYRCNNRDCPRTIFLLQSADKGHVPAVKQQIVDMTRNGSGVRDIVRVLGVSSATVICHGSISYPTRRDNKDLCWLRL